MLDPWTRKTRMLALDLLELLHAGMWWSFRSVFCPSDGPQCHLSLVQSKLLTIAHFYFTFPGKIFLSCLFWFKILMLSFCRSKWMIMGRLLMPNSRHLDVGQQLPQVPWPRSGSKGKLWVQCTVGKKLKKCDRCSYIEDCDILFQLDEASSIKNTEIAKELCLPPVKLHCSSELHYL